MLLSLSALPSTSLSSVPSAAVTSAVKTKSTKQLAWQPAVYLVVVLGTVIVIHTLTLSFALPPPRSHLIFPPLPTVFVAIVASVIWLIWNDPCIRSTPRRGKMESIETDSAFHFPSGETIMSFSSDRTTFLTIPRVFVCSCLRSLPSPARPYVQIIRCVCHRQHRHSSKEC